MSAQPVEDCYDRTFAVDFVSAGAEKASTCVEAFYASGRSRLGSVWMVARSCSGALAASRRPANGHVAWTMHTRAAESSDVSAVVKESSLLSFFGYLLSCPAGY